MTNLSKIKEIKEIWMKEKAIHSSFHCSFKIRELARARISSSLSYNHIDLQTAIQKKIKKFQKVIEIHLQ